MPGGAEQTEVELPAGTTVGALRERLGLPEQHIWLVSISGRQCREDAVLKDGDTVTFLAPVDGG